MSTKSNISVNMNHFSSFTLFVLTWFGFRFISSSLSSSHSIVLTHRIVGICCFGWFIRILSYLHRMLLHKPHFISVDHNRCLLMPTPLCQAPNSSLHHSRNNIVSYDMKSPNRKITRKSTIPFHWRLASLCVNPKKNQPTTISMSFFFSLVRIIIKSSNRITMHNKWYIAYQNTKQFTYMIYSQSCVQSRRCCHRRFVKECVSVSSLAIDQNINNIY